MIVYWILLLISAFIAYTLGSMNTMVIASNFVFRTRLSRLGTGNVWLSNFKRIYGVWGFVKLLLVELVKDIIPILIGGWLLGIKGHAEVGRAFAGFCLVLGRLYPVFYSFKGSHASICMIVLGLMVNGSVGIPVALVVAAGVWFSRSVAMGTIIGAVIFVAASMLLVDNNLTMLLCIFAGVLILIKHIPAISRLLNGREERLSFEEDISYKFDEKF